MGSRSSAWTSTTRCSTPRERRRRRLQWICADLAAFDLERGFDVVALPGNVLLFCRPAVRRDVVCGSARHVATGGRLILGFSLEAGPTAVTLAEVDAAATNEGLVLEDRFATWERQPFAGGDYAVSVYRRPADVAAVLLAPEVRRVIDIEGGLQRRDGVVAEGIDVTPLPLALALRTGHRLRSAPGRRVQRRATARASTRQMLQRLGPPPGHGSRRRDGGVAGGGPACRPRGRHLRGVIDDRCRSVARRDPHRRRRARLGRWLLRRAISPRGRRDVVCVRPPAVRPVRRRVGRSAAVEAPPPGSSPRPTDLGGIDPVDWVLVGVKAHQTAGAASGSTACAARRPRSS